MLVTENHDLNFAVPFNGVSVSFRVVCETNGSEESDYDSDFGIAYNHSVEWGDSEIDVSEIMVTDAEGDKILRASKDCYSYAKCDTLPKQEEIDFAKNWVKENVEPYATEEKILELTHLFLFSL